ncbi:MAG: NAD(+) diphosphatase [Pseudomonadota bacterium]
MKDAELVTFGGGDIDRAAHLRSDEAALAAMARDPQARALAFWRGKPALSGEETLSLAWFPMAAPVLAEAKTPPIFLGLEHQAPRFAYDVSTWDDPDADDAALRAFADPSANRHPSFASDVAFRDLRGNMSSLKYGAAGNAAAAKGMFAWHQTHGFCARCGSPSDMSLAGWRRTCPACGAHHFPRTDPVVIMLIVSGNHALMGRSPGWPEGMYSLLAGFMEPGETIEAAVRRETLEETGVQVGEVGYLASQPWPFPASLMIGCWGQATSTALKIDPDEIEAARWVSREDMAAALAGRSQDMKPARQGSIARFLLERWVADAVRLAH